MRTLRPLLTASLVKLNACNPAGTCRSAKASGLRIMHPASSEAAAGLLIGYWTRHDPKLFVYEKVMRND